MSWYPKYQLYTSDELSLVYAFDYITSENSPQDPIKYTEISGVRGQGSIIVSGSNEAWDLSLKFFLCGTDYTDLISKMDSLESTIVKNTPYVLKIGRTISTTKNYKVKRLQPIVWETSQRVKFTFGTIIFRVDTWA